MTKAIYAVRTESDSTWSVFRYDADGFDIVYMSKDEIAARRTSDELNKAYALGFNAGVLAYRNDERIVDRLIAGGSDQ